MSSSSRPESTIYIYSPMEAKASQNKLSTKREQLIAEDPAFLQQLMEEHQALWFLRESNQNGMLTACTLTYESVQGQEAKWYFQQNRLALTDDGWVPANSPQQFEAAKEKMKHVTAETASHYKEQLDAYLQSLGLQLQFRMTPLASEQSQNNIYSQYNANRTQVNLPQEMQEAFTCPVTNRLMKDPVVCAVTTTIPDGKFKGRQLLQGRSYEKEVLLESKGLDREGHDFYPNQSLKKIMDYVGATNNSLEKLKKIDEYEINDPVTLVKFVKPLIAPSGRTYSEDTVNNICNRAQGQFKDPIHREECAREAFVPNTNVADVVSGWQRYFKNRETELSNPLEEKKQEISSSPSPKRSD